MNHTEPIQSENGLSGEPCLRVLVAEDDPVQASQLLRLVESMGYVVDTVASGTQCLGCLAEQGVDILILDIFMPDMDGAEVLQAIQSRPDIQPRKGTVLISGLDDEFAIQELLRQGASVFLTKPILSSTLQSVLGKLARSSA